MNRATFLRLTDEINASVERHLWRWSALFVMLVLTCSIARDVRTKMWLDEFYTLTMARQASSGEIVKATMEGADGAPPLYAIMVHTILPAVKPEALAVRLPSTIGYCGMFLCLLAFCRRRMPTIYALATAVLACAACLTYSHEGRGYGLELGCAAGALLSWQAAVSGARRIQGLVGLAFCVALMTALHYYAVFFLGPLLLAEIIRWRMTGRLDGAVLAAMAVALLVLGAHYPLIAGGTRFQAHYWSRVTWSMIPEFYLQYFLPVLGVSLLPLFSIPVLTGPPSNRSASGARMSLYEWVAICALSLMPLVVIAISKYTTHVFVLRYAIWAVIGFAVLAGAVLSAAASGRAAIGTIMLCAAAGALILLEARSLFRPPVLRYGQAVLQALNTLPDGPEPIVIGSPFVFMELSYYAEPRLRERFIYPLSPEAELRYRKKDTNSQIFSALRHRTKLHIISLEALLKEYPRFIITATDEDYLPRHLAATGYRVLPIRWGAASVLYEAVAPAGH